MSPRNNRCQNGAAKSRPNSVPAVTLVSLTPRELEVARWIAEAKRNHESSSRVAGAFTRASKSSSRVAGSSSRTGIAPSRANFTDHFAVNHHEQPTFE